MTAILVTGATGFLGARVIAKLTEQGCTVTTLARHAADLEADLSIAADAARVLANWRWDACVNLAAPVTGGTEDLATGIATTATHARIALHLKQHARGRLVHASSMTVYGVPQASTVTEDHPRQPLHLYGLGKLVAEDVLLTAPSVETAVMRFGGLFSEQRRGGGLFHFSRAAHQGLPLRVSAPQPTPWELLHVDDAAEGLVRAALARGVTGAINLGYGEPVELVAIAHRFAALGGGRSTVETLPGVTHPPFQLDITRARAVLGWDPPALADRLRDLHEAFAS